MTPAPARISQRLLDRGGVRLAQRCDRLRRRVEQTARCPGIRDPRVAQRVGRADGDTSAGGGRRSARHCTLILPQAAFGTVASNWVFTVALTGQDGFGTDQARNFTQPAGQFTFGVCAPGGTAPICSFNPNEVPKVMDTILPPGVSQATELDPTRGPVQLQRVSP
jgi:C-terminal binding-module, SLH-like, of glucodextranase